jgi:hypothetical protein
MTDNTDSSASNQTHVPIEGYVHLQKKYLESVLTEQSFMIEIKELLDKSIEANARIAELEAVITAATVILSEFGVSEDKIEDAYNVLTAAISSSARAALRGEKIEN